MIYLLKEKKRSIGKKAMLAEIELREAIFQRKGYANESTTANLQIAPSTTPIEQVDICIDRLRQAVKYLGGKLVITAKFPDSGDISNDSIKSTIN